MATSYKKTLVKSYPRIGEKVTTDTIYWRNLEVPVTKKEYGAITSIDFCPVDPYHFAVTNSTRVQIYSPRSLQIIKTFSRFKDVAHSGCFRDDGRLLVAGGDEGEMKLFDVGGRALLRVFKGHSGSVHVTKFLSSGVHLFSGADDNTVRVWDIPSEQELTRYKEHQDYVRCGVASGASNDLLLTGSYDHTVKLFDKRTSESVLTVEHGQPVESVVMFPTGGVFISAGGNVIKVWDVLAGGKLLTTLCHHHKTVTTLNFCSNYQRLLSGSLDRHVKIYDVSSYQVVHTLDYSGSILSLGVAPDDSLLVVGMAEGLVSLQRRKTEEVVKNRKKQVSYRYALKGKTYVPHKDSQVVEHKKREKLAEYDKYFKTFAHTKALDAALEGRVRTRYPDVTVSVMQELIRRGGIKAALAGRDDKSLGYLFRFIQKNISNPHYMSTLTDVATLAVEIYSQTGQSTATDTILLRLKKTVDQEVNYMKKLQQVMGTLDTLFVASAAPSTNQNTAIKLSDITPSLTAQAAS